MKTSIKLFSLILLWIFSLGASTASVALNDNSPKEHHDHNTIKVALLLDTSNSMDGLIDQAKAQLWEIVNQLSFAKHGGANPDLSIALYEYGNDRLEASDGYIRKVLDFSQDLDMISEKLFSLTTNGGSEYCGAVIQQSLKDLRWGNEKDDLNLIFIAGNEAFTQGSISYLDATADANKKDVTVNTIFCGNYQNGVSGNWADAAGQTHGQYFAIDQNKKQIYVATPFDAIILQLNIKLNKTYVSYGTQGYVSMENQNRQDTNAMGVNEEVAVKRAVSKSNRLYSNSSWDLVDASKDKSFKLEEVEKKDLPKSLQGKSETELKAYIADQAKQRKDIQAQINALSVQRTAYIAKNQSKGDKDNLGNALIETIKTQAKKKNYSW